MCPDTCAYGRESGSRFLKACLGHRAEHHTPCPGSLAVALMDGQLPDAQRGGGSWLCCKHTVVRCHLPYMLRLSAVFTLSLITPHLPLSHAVFVYRNKPYAVVVFVTASHTQKALGSSCSHYDVINQMPQIRHIGHCSATALSFLRVQITA